ncbi:MAG: hypothetical protein LC792_28350, partial [Actinobacteria bacterium]|nr:hypothetical protein [Actinomycetota bacterium]
PRTHYNRIRVDLGYGDDYLERDDEDSMATPPFATMEIHTGPGVDNVSGGEGNDQIFADGDQMAGRTRNADGSITAWPPKTISCAGGDDKIYTHSWAVTMPAGDCEHRISYPGYPKAGFAQFRTATTVTTIRGTVTTTTSPTPVTSPPPVTTTTTR